MSWNFSSAPTADEPPAPTSTTSLGALGLGAAASVAHNPAAQRAATEFAEDEGVQEAASSFASDQRVQRAFFKTVGVPTAYLPGTEGSSSSSSSTTTTTSSSSSASSSLPQSTSLPPASNSSTSTSRRPSAAALASNIGTSTSRRPSAAALAAAAAFQDSQESQQSHRHTNTNTSSSSSSVRELPHEKGGGQLQHQHQRQRRRPPLSSTFIAHPDYGKKRQSTHSDNEKLSSSPPPSPPPPAPLYMLDPFPNSNIPESFRQQFRLYTFVGTHEQEQISQQNQHVDKQSLDYLLTQLYHEHVKESHSSSGSQWNQEQIQEGLHLESLLSDYMNMNDRSYNRTTYSNDEDNEYVQSDQQSQLASLMYQRIQLQAKEDEMRQREYLYN